MVTQIQIADFLQIKHPGPSQRLKKTIDIDTHKVLLKESGVNLTLTIVDTPGFGDAVDNSNCWDPVISYVESQYESFLDAETRVHRVQMPDSRVHACLYFIAPSGHGLKPLDVEFMKRLHDKVSKTFRFFTKKPMTTNRICITQHFPVKIHKIALTN